MAARFIWAAALSFASPGVVPISLADGVGLREQSVRRRANILSRLPNVGDVPYGREALQQAIATILSNIWQAPAGLDQMEMHCLARMADVLGRTQDQTRWRLRIDALNRRTREVCYDPRDNLFYDLEIASGQFRRNISPWHLVPLWAGIPMEKALVQDMIRRYLLGKLMGQVPFPIVSRDDPAYLPDVYWRGPSWPQLWLIMLQTLWWHGFQKEADRAADQLVEICHRNPYLMETYDSQSGQGISLPLYSFAAAILMEIVLRRYRDDPPWRVTDG